MRLRRGGMGIDSHDVGALRRASLRTRLVRSVLVAAAVALLVLATASARGLDTEKPTLLPDGSGVLVVDLSLSIGERDFQNIRRAVRRLVDDNGSIGLVIFSDQAYELLPPGTPAAELRSLDRFLVSRRATRVDAGLPVNPWSEHFSAGTRISSALELARDILVRDGVKNGSILLVSDLVTAPEDVPELARTLNELKGQSIAIRVVALSPLKTGRTVFENLLGKKALIAPAELRNPGRVLAETEAALPTGLLLLGGFLLAVLAAHERFAARLGLPRARRGST
jgi:von Willebrand factor type A domain